MADLSHPNDTELRGALGNRAWRHETAEHRYISFWAERSYHHIPNYVDKIDKLHGQAQQYAEGKARDANGIKAYGI